MIKKFTTKIDELNTWVAFITTTSGTIVASIFLVVSFIEKNNFINKNVEILLATLTLSFLFISVWSYRVLKKYLIIEPENKRSLLAYADKKIIPNISIGAYIRLHDKDVLDFQVSLVSHISKNENYKIIDAFDLTTDPSRWFTRTQYLEENKKFIDSNGQIRRVLIIDESCLDNYTFAISLYKLINLFEDLGIKIGMQLKEYGYTDEDFILYGTQAVMKELVQADINYSQAESIIFLDKKAVYRYKEKFLNTWEKSSTISIKERFHVYMSSICQDNYNAIKLKEIIFDVSK